jgi:hypothetical protein
MVPFDFLHDEKDRRSLREGFGQALGTESEGPFNLTASRTMRHHELIAYNFRGRSGEERSTSCLTDRKRKEKKGRTYVVRERRRRGNITMADRFVWRARDSSAQTSSTRTPNPDLPST